MRNGVYDHMLICERQYSQTFGEKKSSLWWQIIISLWLEWDSRSTWFLCTALATNKNKRNAIQGGERNDIIFLACICANSLLQFKQNLSIIILQNLKPIAHRVLNQLIFVIYWVLSSLDQFAVYKYSEWYLIFKMWIVKLFGINRKIHHFM